MRLEVNSVLVPNPLDTYGQFYRFYHYDIATKKTEELADEFHYLRAHLWGLPSGSWLRERTMMLERELCKRRGRK